MAINSTNMSTDTRGGGPCIKQGWNHEVPFVPSRHPKIFYFQVPRM